MKRKKLKKVSKIPIKERIKEKVKRLEEFLRSKEGCEWLKESREELFRLHKNKEGIFSPEEDEIWENLNKEDKT